MPELRPLVRYDFVDKTETYYVPTKFLYWFSGKRLAAKAALEARPARVGA